MQMKVRISEIFQSIQGEGPYVGVRQVFVRFMDCQLKCSWCDTVHTRTRNIKRSDEMTVAQVFSKMKKLWDRCHSVSLTGGEPLLQADFIKELLPLLRKAGMPVYLETNGIDHRALKKNIAGNDIISMDIKLPSSTGDKAFWRDHEKFLAMAKQKEVFIKAVVTGKTTQPDIVKAVGLVKRVAPRTPFILQPNTGDLHNGAVSRCLEFQKYCLKHLPDVRMIPQMHPFMKLR